MTAKTLTARLAECQSAITIEGVANIRKSLEARADEGIVLHERKDSEGVYISKALPQPISKAFDPYNIEPIKAAAIAAGIQWEDKEFIEETEKGRRARALRFRASDERIDRSGDITRQDWRLDYFNQVGHILLGHDWSTKTLPLARAIQNDIEDKADAGYNGKALMHTLLFARRETNELGGQVYDLARLGLFNTMSVGYFPHRVIHIQDAGERDKIGPGFSGYILEDNELVETSMVNVPANAGAIQEIAKVAGVFAKHSDILTPGHFDLFRSTITRSTENEYREPISATLRAIGQALYGKDPGPTDLDSGLDENTAIRLAAIQKNLTAMEKISGDFLNLHKSHTQRSDGIENRLSDIEKQLAKLSAKEAAEQARQAKAQEQEIAMLAAEGCLTLDFPIKTADSNVDPANDPTPAKPCEGQAQDGVLGLAYILGHAAG